MTPIKLIALDIDGTLLDSDGRLPHENIAALVRAVDAGIEIVLATGRRFEFARPIFIQIAAPLTLILSNGAIVKQADGTTLLRHLLPRSVARAILDEVPQHRATAALVFDRPREGQIVYERVDWNHPRHGKFFTSNREFISEVIPLEDALTEDPLQVMFTGNCGAMRSVFEHLLGHAATMPREAPAAMVTPGARPDAYSVALTEYEHRDFSLVDIIHAGCSKGSALAEWARRRGIPAGAIMAIGDNLNDLDMLTFAGRPVVMANAVQELKSRGWRMTSSNDDGGVARAIDEILRS